MASLDEPDRPSPNPSVADGSQSWCPTVLEHAPDAVIGVAASGEIILWNREAGRVFGWSPREALGRQARALLGEGLERVAAEPGADSPVQRPIESRLRDRSGKELPSEVILIACPAPAGGNEGEARFFFVRDLRGRRESEAELRRSRDQLRVIIEGVADGILVQDHAYRCVYVNEVGARLCGYPSAAAMRTAAVDETIRKFEIHDEQGRPFPLDRLPAQLALKGEAEPPEEVMRVRELGTDRETWSIVSARPILDEQGLPQLAVSIFRDITESKLRELGRKFLAEASTALAASLDLAATLKKAADLPVAALCDACTVFLVGPDSRLAAVETSARSEEAAARARDPECADPAWLLVRFGARGGGAGAFGFASCRDRQVAREYTALASSAIENARLYGENESHRQRLNETVGELRVAIQARDEFLSICSHELKTPVTSLKLQAQLTDRLMARNDRNAFDPAAFRKFVELALRQSDRLDRLIEDMLDVSRIVTGRLSVEVEPADLSKLAVQVADRFGAELKSREIPLRVDASCTAPVSCDHYRIEQVISNLMTNALKYGEGRPLQMRVWTQDGVARLSLRDQGNGIAPENLERIFQRFERAVPAANISGLGLGLFISRQIMAAHGGSLTVESEIGRGSTFTLGLPLSGGPGLAVREAP